MKLSLTLPSSTSFIGGTMKPSWNRLSNAGLIELGTPPPMSEQCTKLQP